MLRKPHCRKPPLSCPCLWREESLALSVFQAEKAYPRRSEAVGQFRLPEPTALTECPCDLPPIQKGTPDVRLFRQMLVLPTAA